MKFTTLTNWMNSFQILGFLDSNLQFHSNFKSTFCKQAVQNSAVSDLVLHCLPLIHKMDARFIWVKIY